MTSLTLLLSYSDQEEELVDERCLSIGDALFRPSVYDIQALGVHEAVHQCIQNCDVDLRKDLYGNIVLSGGSTLFSGFRERLEEELVILAPQHARVRVIAPPERRYSAFLGAAIVSSLSTFAGEKLVSRSDYEEFGPSICNYF